MVTPPRAGSAVTLAQVAGEAGVSLATASRALHGGSPHLPRPELRDRVLEAAARLNYTTNTHAQAVARGTSNVVGMIVADMADPYFSSIAAGVIRAAESHELMVSIADTRRQPGRELAWVTALRRQRARALVIAGSRTRNRPEQERLAAELAAFSSTGGRVALISQRVLPYDTVVVENRAGARDLARQLIGLGHDRFAILAGPSALQTSRDRVAGFRAGLPPGASAPRIVDCEFTRDGGYAGMRALLDSGLRGGCVFAVNDVMAVGAIAALREAHVDVPAGIAIAGFDDIATLRDIAPPLTTVHVPLEDLGMAAAEFVLDDHRGGPRLRRVRPVVVLRDSTAREGARPSTDG